MAFGDRRPYLVAVIVPDPDFAAAYARAHGGGATLAELGRDAGFVKAVGEVVARASRGLPGIERVRRFVIADEPFTTANGQMTPTLKVRRHTIRAAYGPALEALYDGKEAAA
jgi:long-chain acyl-CoA synthetase